ncbi:hypothetical protein GQ53DRAFT_329220 [Thozetella sp. PMI_491]|nr:hypothetical protein GQ53DRAFT_329220 [Thozetella sp. PMI_491]
MAIPQPPNAFAMTPPGSQSSRRISRFTEHPMQEYTPANSIYEEELEYANEDGDLRGGRVLLRIANAVVHLVLCTLMLAIMGSFMQSSASTGNFPSHVIPEAITLLVLLTLDITLDLLALVRFRRRWQSWALLLRLVFAIGYLALFMVYVAFGRAFAPGFSYFGMQPGFSGPVLYIFLWIVGIWNLLHTAVRRHRLGNGMRTYIAAIRSGGAPRAGALNNDEQAAPQRRASNRTPSTTRIARTWGRMRRGAPSDYESRPRSHGSTQHDSISLHERREDEEDKTASVTSTLSRGKSDEAGETGLRPPPRAARQP